MEHDLQQLIRLGKKKGFVSLEDIVREYPGAEDPSQMDDIQSRLEKAGVTILKKSVIREWTESIVIAFILAMIIRAFFFQAFRIPSGSMRMTLIEGDRLIVNKLRYGPQLPFTVYRFPGFRKPQRGDVVVFKFPLDPKRDFIKRLIATGGETVEIRQGDIYINGKRVDDPAIKNIYYYNRGPYGAEGVPVRVPEGHFFVLGDNSASSHDSRYWGFVPEQNVIGMAELIYWPPNRLRFIR